MSVSDVKQLANQLNAQHSTGPRSDEGKARSSRNAIKHGLFSRELLLPGEDPAALSSLREGMLRRLGPRDVLEMQLVEQYIRCAWKLRRLRSAEHQAYLDEMHTMRQQLLQSRPDTPQPLPEPDSGLVMWRMMQGGKDAALERLSSHEQRLWNTMQRCLRELEKRQQQELAIPIEQPPAEHDANVQNEPTEAQDAVDSRDEAGLYRAAWEQQRAAEAQAEQNAREIGADEAPPAEKSAA
jgi:hypothetical protein